ncbi:MAG: DUF2961 domain-containing protein [Phycisphaerae bacterium]|nr:DUF2961 domain-containing protein [Phycisphaerae bacterium]
MIADRRLHPRPQIIARPILAGLLILALEGPVLAQGLLEGLARPIPGRSMRSTSAFRKGADGNYDPKADPLGTTEPISNRDARDLPAGQTQTVLDVKGPGVVTHIWFTFRGPEPAASAPNGAANHQEMLLRMYWDDQEKPAVEVPMGDFFANAFGFRSEVISLPVVVEDADSYNCYWRMPFRKSARIEVINQSDKPLRGLYHNIDWVRLDSLPEDTPYFYAQYRQEYPVEQGKDYVLLETQGKGHYVGTVLAVRMRSPAWFGEGDEKIYIDGEAKPSIWGTGTEDYFCSAWGLKACKTPYFGVPYFKQRGVGAYTSSYRWHLADPIVFNTGIKVTIEHWGWMSPDENPDYKAMSWNERQDDYASVAYWYQTGTPTFAARAPDARERTLPSLDRTVVYAKDFTDEKHHGPGEARPQSLPSLYREPQLLYRPASAEAAWIEIPFKVAAKEPRRLLIHATCAPDYGQYQATLNGVKLGEPLDFYADKIDSNEFHLLDFWPEPGDYVLRLECVGKNAASSGCLLGLEYVRLRERRPRVTTMGHDKDKDWKAHPMLYR